MQPSDLVPLQAAADRLAISHTDLGAWWTVSLGLATAGDDAAPESFAALANVASDLGAAALAIACAQWLREHGDQQASSEILERVAVTHCAGSPRIDRALKPGPLMPPPNPSDNDATPAADVVLKAARAAAQAAAKHANEYSDAAVAPTPLIGGLSERGIRELAQVMRLKECAAGDVVVTFGEPARSLYWVARGAVEVSRDESVLGILRANAFFGEIALVGQCTRTATVTCLDATWLLEIPAESIEAAAANVPRLARTLANYARSRLLAGVMRSSELFSRLSEAERAELLPKFITTLAAPGETVIAKGEENDRLYVVASGSCRVVDDDHELATLSIGDGVGEMSLLSRKPATANVIANDSCVLLSIARGEFDEVAVRHPGLLAEVYKLVVERERHTLVHQADEFII